MKKFYLVLSLIAVSSGSLAQDDISATFVNFNNGDVSEMNPIDLSFNITNTGTTDLPSGTELHMTYGILEGSSVVDLIAPGSWNNGSTIRTIGSTPFAQGQFTLVSSSGTPVAKTVFTMQDIYDLWGRLNPQICALVGLNSLQQSPPQESTYNNNLVCINYTVTSVVGLENNDFSKITAYPNPANDLINFNIGTNDVEVINIRDVAGRLIETITVSNTVESLNTASYENGVYFYQITNGDEIVKTAKFAVSH